MLSVSVAGGAAAQARVVWGDVHAHSGFSQDGRGAPSDFYVNARDVAKLDFVILTDHDVWVSKSEWEVLTDGERIVLDFDVNGIGMGGQLSAPLGTAVTATIAVTGTSVPTAIELVLNGSVVATKTDCARDRCVLSAVAARRTSTCACRSPTKAGPSGAAYARSPAKPATATTRTQTPCVSIVCRQPTEQAPLGPRAARPLAPRL